MTVPAKTAPAAEIVEGTPAAETINNKPVHSRAELMAMAMANLASMKPDDLTDFFYKSIERAEAQPLGNEAAHNAATLSMKPSAASPQVHEAIKADLTSLFEGTGVSEDFVEKATTLFEAAVSGRVAVERAAIEEESEAKIQEEVAGMRTELAEKLDGYASYAAEQWMTENQVAVDSSLKSELVSDFITGLKTLFTEHYVEVPDDKVDVLEELTKRVEQLEENLNKAVDENVELKKAATAATMRATFEEVSRALTDIQVERFKGLTETVAFEGDVEALRTKLITIREANFKDAPPVAKATGINESTDEVVTIEVTGTDPADKPKIKDPGVAALVRFLDSQI